MGNEQSKGGKDSQPEVIPSSELDTQSSNPPLKRKRGRPPKTPSPSEVQTNQRNRKAKSAERSEPVVPQGTAWDALENPEKYALPPQGRGYAAQHAEVLRSDVPREQTNVRIRSELKRAAQIVAVTRNMSLGDVIEEALIDYLKKHGRSALEL